MFGRQRKDLSSALVGWSEGTKKGKTKCKDKGVAGNTLISKNGKKKVLQLDIRQAKEERSDAESKQKLTSEVNEMQG